MPKASCKSVPDGKAASGLVRQQAMITGATATATMCLLSVLQASVSAAQLLFTNMHLFH